MPCEILPSREFYDYEDKYELNLARTGCPAGPAGRRDCSRCAVWRSSATKPWDAKGWAGSISCVKPRPAKLYINEINTVPGFTSISMFPKMWAYSGIPYAELIDRLIELALERHAAKKATRFTR